MDYALFLSSLLLFALPMCFSPGPNNTMSMVIAMTHGFRSIFPYVFGATLGALGTFFLTSLGLGEMLQRFPAVYLGLRIAGAAYLIWLALGIAGLNPLPMLLRLTKKDKKAAKVAQTPQKPLNVFQGITFQLLNVKVWMGHLIAISTYAGADEYMWRRIVIIGFLTCSLGGLANLAWAAGGAAMNRFLSSEGIRRANYIFAASLILSVLFLFFQ